jgi:hypothetical protein
MREIKTVGLYGTARLCNQISYQPNTEVASFVCVTHRNFLPHISFNFVRPLFVKKYALLDIWRLSFEILCPRS